MDLVVTRLPKIQYGIKDSKHFAQLKYDIAQGSARNRTINPTISLTNLSSADPQKSEAAQNQQNKPQYGLNSINHLSLKETPKEGEYTAADNVDIIKQDIFGDIKRSSKINNRPDPSSNKRRQFTDVNRLLSQHGSNNQKGHANKLDSMMGRKNTEAPKVQRGKMKTTDKYTEFQARNQNKSIIDRQQAAARKPFQSKTTNRYLSSLGQAGPLTDNHNQKKVAKTSNSNQSVFDEIQAKLELKSFNYDRAQKNYPNKKLMGPPLSNFSSGRVESSKGPNMEGKPKGNVEELQKKYKEIEDKERMLLGNTMFNQRSNPALPPYKPNLWSANTGMSADQADKSLLHANLEKINSYLSKNQECLGNYLENQELLLEL